MENLQAKIHREQRMAQDPGQVLHLSFVLADGAQTRTLNPGENTVYISTGNAANTLALTLPNVQECIGQIFYIKALATVNAATTLTDNGDDAAFADKTLDADGDYIVLYCTGEEWVVLVNGIA